MTKLLDLIDIGDTIVATEVSRITRSTQQLCEIIQIAKDKRLRLIFGNYVVDCSGELDPKAKPACIDYVVLHELVHFIFPNHSKQFYDFLSIHMPDWKERKRVLDLDVVHGI